MKNLILIAVATTLAAACAPMKVKILDVASVSMTRYSIGEGEKLQELGNVSGQFCADSIHDKGNIGLLDEAIKKAQASSGADFIHNTTVWSDGAGCVTVEGLGEKIVRATTPAAANHKK